MRKLTLLTMLIIFAAASMLQAQIGHCDRPIGSGMHHRGFGDGHFPLMECKEELSLTDEQTDKIGNINFEFRNKMIDLKAEMEKLQLSKRHEMKSDNPDKAKVLMLTKQINDVHGRIAESNVEHKFTLREVLTKEQLEKWQDCRHKCKNRCGNSPRLDAPGDGSGRGMKCGRR